MQTRCEACGTWVDEAHTHIVDDQCLCVLCAFQAQGPSLWQGQDLENKEV